MKQSFINFKNWLKDFFLNNETKKTLSEVDRLNIRLKELFKLNEGFVVALNGEWGVGKTHFWNKFIEENFTTEEERKNIAYVSLFGKDKLTDIESDIIMQVSRIAKIKGYLDNSIGSIGYAGFKVSNVLSLISKVDFKNIVICFDDFERKSSKIDSKDILGLISQFKEQKNCKVIMIYNQIEIGDKKILSDYKDKAIDYELHYKPTVEESYKTVSKKLKVFNDYPLEYLKSKGINNIRVIKRLINALNDFEFIAIKLENNKDIEEEIVSSIMKLAVVNAKYNDFDLHNTIEYVREKRFGDKKSNFVENKEIENMLFLLGVNNDYFFTNDLLENINYYIKNSIINKENLVEIVNQKLEQKEQRVMARKISTIYSKYNYDLKYSNESFVKDMFSLLQEAGENVVDTINSVESFMYYIEEMQKIDNDSKYKEFAIGKIKLYIDLMYETNIRELQAFGKLQRIKDFDSSLEDYINEKDNAKNQSQIKSKEDIINLFNQPIINRSWGNEPDLLASINKTTYKKYIEESPVFFSEAMSFVRWTQGFAGNSGFEEAVDRIIEAFKELSNNPEYNSKVAKVLNYMIIKKEKEKED